MSSEQLAALAKRFPKSVIHQVPIAAGKTADYVPASVVAEKLLAIVGPFGWSVRAVDAEHVVGTLEVTIDGRTVSVDGIGDGNDRKAQESDAFKRAARWLGLGLHLWSGADYRLDRALTKTDASEAVRTDAATA